MIVQATGIFGKLWSGHIKLACCIAVILHNSSSSFDALI
jgi:hypothetical protein